VPELVLNELKENHMLIPSARFNMFPEHGRIYVVARLMHVSMRLKLGDR